jgi:UMF1 family MFS transporter
LLSLNVFMTLNPQWFGLADAALAVRLSFVMVASWWLVFSIPLMALVPEPKNHPPAVTPEVLGIGFRRIGNTLRSIRKLRHVWLFLVAYWLYIDGVDTIIRMAVDYGLSLGFEQENLILALLITQFTGFPAALLFGRLGSRYGPRAGIFLALLIYMAVTVLGALMDEVADFYLLAFAIGLAQGGIQALSRSLYARMIPVGQTAEFFGFYNMLGKFAAILGPFMMGWVGLTTGSPRAGVLPVGVVCGGGRVAVQGVRVSVAGQVGSGRSDKGVPEINRSRVR